MSYKLKFMIMILFDKAKMYKINNLYILKIKKKLFLDAEKF